VSDDKDRESGGSNGARPAPKTVVGVPALPADRPSDLQLTRELPPKPEVDATDELPTVHAMKAVTVDDADRVLASGGATAVPPAAGSSPGSPRAPAVAGALARPAQRPAVPTKRPPTSGGEMFTGLGPASGRSMGLELPTQPGVAPQPGLSPKGRVTLLLDSSSPPGVVSDG
jgi:hypothetical protein